VILEISIELCTPLKYVQEFSGEHNLVANYLVDEVLARQDAKVQQFLIETSILNRFSSSLCNAILQIDDAWDVLLYLERRNIFIVSLDEKNEWFRYHHLFSEMLRGRLKQRAPDDIAALYNRAIDWHVNERQMEEAIDYAIEGKLFDRAAELIIMSYDQLQTGLQQTRLQSWLHRIPLNILRKSDDLWLYYNLSQFYFSDFDNSLKYLQSNQNKLSTEELQKPIFATIENTLLGTILLHTTLDAIRVQKLVQKGLDISPDGPHLIRGIAKGHFGSASLLLGDLETAEIYVREALQLLENTNNWPVTYVFLNIQAEILAAQGKLHQAITNFKNNYQKAKDRGTKNAICSGNLISMGMLHYEWNQMEEAERYIRIGQQFCLAHTSIDRMLQAVYASLKLQHALETVPNIEDSLKQIEIEAAKFDYPLLVMDRIEALQSLCEIIGGSRRRAERWAQTYAQRNQDAITCLRQQGWLVVARIWMETNKLSKAIDVLQALMNLAKQDGRIRDWVELCVILTKALYLNGETEQAEALLSKGITVAEPEGYIRSFLDEAEPIRMLLTKFQRDKSNIHYQSKYILKILNATSQGKTERSHQILTPRELEIVHLLAMGLRYSQIAERLTITENTLKFHIKNIYGKLNVNSRTQAVLLAQERNLL
jgi:LuxR family transcriptional regulator, maltose regulon positive regulatory protein